MGDLKDLIRLYLDEQIEIAKVFPVDEVERLAQTLIRTYDQDGSVYLMANGGPAGQAEGFATDLRVHPFVGEDKGETIEIRRLRVQCLNESSSVITCISNDVGYDRVFVDQLKNYMRRDRENQYDLAIAFSGSGNSKNVLNAFEYAKGFGVTTACISGRDGGKAKDLSDICIIVPGSSKFPGQTGKNDNNFHVEDFQTIVSHIVTGLLKAHVGR